MIYLKVHQNAQTTRHTFQALISGFILSPVLHVLFLFVKNVFKNQGLGHLDLWTKREYMVAAGAVTEKTVNMQLIVDVEKIGLSVRSEEAGRTC